MKLVTFAVPCYNVEQCVAHCFDSILQAGHHEEIEILAINDGSRDNTLQVLQNYAKQYPDVVRVLNKENGGWGTAINLAIREAQGKYFKEIDADDEVETGNIANYLQTLATIDVDYVATAFREYNSQTKSSIEANLDDSLCNRAFDIKDFWDNHPQAWAFPIHAITYNTQFIRDIHLSVGDRYYTDFEYFLKSMPYVRTLYLYNRCITIYNRGNEEQSTGIKGYAKHYRDMADLSLRLVQFYTQIPAAALPAIQKSIRDTIIGTIAMSYELMMSPVYAGKNVEAKQELRRYDKALAQHPLFYRAMRSVKKKGIPYISIWRSTRINLLALR